MTANNYKVGDAVQRKSDPNTKYIVSKVTDKGIVVYIPNFSPSPEYGMNACDLEPYDNTQYCRYCGVKIELITHYGEWVDDSEHLCKCPVRFSKHGYATEQEAIYAYSMKGEG